MDGDAYVDPFTPGAPQVGDVVVVVHDYPPDPGEDSPGIEGYTVVVASKESGPVWRMRWIVSWDNHTTCVYAVRRPTPEELAVYQLSRGA